ncbi:predicted protein [Botrytis cinerea T4]|uniref:Uncharacterized protein n=1 Tax=Botryotinia fuckeliana (strain T4) TaxID=999810 RepID=G2YK55_BOTF4|nr:predicted protein [Botrytis cinerea T4]
MELAASTRAARKYATPPLRYDSCSSCSLPSCAFK